MKKFTLIAAAAAVAMSASAQFNTPNLSTADVLKNYPSAYIDYVILNADTEALLQKDANYTLQYVGPNDAGRNLYIWSNGETLVANEAGLVPGVDGGTGYLSMNQVADQEWCGAGFNVGEAEPANFSHFTDETVLHVAYCSLTGNDKVKSMYLTILNTAPANNISLGTSNDGAPVAGEAPGEDWKAIEIPMKDLKKLCTGFDAGNLAQWTGNVLAFGGAANNDAWTKGANISLDAVYFVTPKTSAIETIDAAQQNAEAVYYNLQGVRVANPENGVFIMKAGKEVKKVVL